MKLSDPFNFQASHPASHDLAGKYSRAWTESALDIEFNSSNRLGISHTRGFLGNAVLPRRLTSLLVLVGLFFTIIVGRLVYLQIIKGSWYRTLAESNRLRIIPVPAERGIIYDRFNRALVENVPQFTLAITPQDLPRSAKERAETVARLASISGLSPEDIVAALETYGNASFESLTLKDNLDYNTALALYIQNADLPGVHVESGMKRQYLAAASTTLATDSPLTSLSHVLGYVGKLNKEEVARLRPEGYLLSDVIGKTGLEKTYQSLLRGIYGKKKIEVNAAGKEQATLAVDPPIPGNNLVLSIDKDAQSYLEKLMKASAKQTGHNRMAGIALNPQNGEVMALASTPAFNNNDFSGGISSDAYKGYLNDLDHPLFNRAIAGTYPPGSTVKLVISSAALEEGTITVATTVNSTGGLEVGDRFFKDWLPGGHGITNVVKAIAWSVNTFFYYAGGGYQNFVGLGVDRLTDYMRRFNLGALTGIDIPGEQRGFLPSKEWKRATKHENWFVGDTYNLSIGEGDLLVTPLQVAVWTAAIANGGKIITPHIVQKNINPVSHVAALTNRPLPRDTGIKSEYIRIVGQGMHECVESGSCQKLKQLPFAAAGKTGTAEWSKSKPNHAWFTSFAPYDHPQIVVTVLVEEGGEGSVSALPIARDWLAWWGKKYLTY